MDRITYLKELYRYIRCVEKGFGSDILPANPKGGFTLPMGYKLVNHPEIPDQFSRGYIELADPKNILSQNKERLYFKGKDAKRIKLSEDQIFRFFVGQAVPRYEGRAIRQLGQDVWNKIPDDYRKIAVFSLMYNSSGYFNSCVSRVKEAIRNQRWDDLAKYQYECGAKSRKGGEPLRYLINRRNEEAAMIRTNSMQPGVSFQCGGKVPRGSSQTQVQSTPAGTGTQPRAPLRSVDTRINRDFDESPRVEEEVPINPIINLEEGTIDEYDRESESSIFESTQGTQEQRSSSLNIGTENTNKQELPTIGNKRSLSILETNDTQFLGQDPKEKGLVASEGSEKAEDESLTKERELKEESKKKQPLNFNGKDRTLFNTWVYDNSNKDEEQGIDFRAGTSHEYVIPIT